MKVVLLGSGNVATHLGKALQAAGHELLQVWSRTLSHAEELGKTLNIDFTNKFSSLTPQANVYILAVSDQAIENIALQFPYKNKVLVHTSGTTELNINGISGVFYPLQTFSKQKEVDFSGIPIAVEAKDEATEKLLLNLARSISKTVKQLNSDQRKALHVAAVFACNFSNHLYAIASKILENNKLEFEVIKPLIAETAAKVEVLNPIAAQTGPAVRNDEVTMNSHLNFLETNPHLKQLYLYLSQSIINLHQKA